MAELFGVRRGLAQLKNREGGCTSHGWIQATPFARACTRGMELQRSRSRSRQIRLSVRQIMQCSIIVQRSEWSLHFLCERIKAVVVSLAVAVSPQRKESIARRHHIYLQYRSSSSSSSRPWQIPITVLSDEQRCQMEAYFD